MNARKGPNPAFANSSSKSLNRDESRIRCPNQAATPPQARSRKEVPPMSTVDVEQLFGPPEEDDQRHPEFSKVLLGFDPHHVEEFVEQAGERIEVLERQLRDTRSHLEAANRRAGAAREEAYGEVAGRMAELLRAADQQAERIRAEAEEASRRQLMEAAQQGELIKREAETQAEAMRMAGETELATARAEARRVLGELSRHRDAVVGELQALRGHLVGLVERVETAVDTPMPGTDAAAVSLIAPMAPEVDDLLGSSEGFDLAPPAQAEEADGEELPEGIDADDDDDEDPGVALFGPPGSDSTQQDAEILDLSWDETDFPGVGSPPPSPE